MSESRWRVQVGGAEATGCFVWLPLLVITLMVVAMCSAPRPAGADVPVAATAVPQSEFRAVGSGGGQLVASGQTSTPSAAPSQPRTSSPAASAPATVSPSLRAVPRLAAVRNSAPQAAASVTGTQGVASWYRYVPGEAAAGPALRTALGAGWRGARVLVDGVPVTLTDFCGCYGSRLIDLDAATFARLAPLSQGLTEVTISW